MAKNQKYRPQVRDWVIAGLALAIVATNCAWYQNSKTQETKTKALTSAWALHQFEINSLKTCIDDKADMCNINPPQQ